MSKPVYRDLLLIIILAIASLAFLSVPALDQSPLNIIPQIIILLFLPGYALVAVIDPQFHRSPISKRAVFSFTVSLILTIVSVYAPVKFSNYVILVVLTLILSIFALVRRKVVTLEGCV